MPKRKRMRRRLAALKAELAVVIDERDDYRSFIVKEGLLDKFEATRLGGWAAFIHAFQTWGTK